MYRFLFLIPLLILCIVTTAAQEKTGEAESVPGFAKNNEAVGYYLPGSSRYIINQQIGRHIHRTLFDSGLKPITTYSYKTDRISFNRKHTTTPVFVADLQIGNSVYEVYSDKNTIAVAGIDFEKKRDSIVYGLQISTFEQEEKRLAVIPFSKGVRVLTYAQKKNKLILYEWRTDTGSDTTEIQLPKSTLSDEEVKLYSKDARIKYRIAFDNMTVSPADGETILAHAGTNGIYHTEKKIWLLSQTAFFTGYNILEIDLDTYRLHSTNIMVNDMRENNTAHYTRVMKPYALVVNDKLLVRNTSFFSFQYKLYDLATKKKIKEFEAETDTSLKKIIHSDFNQKGTWFSAGDEKIVEREKAFLRKMNSGTGFISVSQNDGDSITVTTGTLITTNGFGGMLVSLGTSMLGYMANITIGSFQIIPYLEIYRTKLLYCHSKFSSSSFEPSAAINITTGLDGLIDNFERKDLRSGSSFIIKKENRLYMAVFNHGLKRFEIFKI